MSTGSGIASFTLSGGLVIESSDPFGHFTGGSWSWSDGTPVLNGNHESHDGDGDAGLRIVDPDSDTGGMIDFTFAADSNGLPRAATLLVRRDGTSSIQAIQGSSIVTIDTGNTEGLVTVDGEHVKPSAKMSNGAVVAVTVPPPVEMELEPEDIPLNIIYQDENVIAPFRTNQRSAYEQPARLGASVGCRRRQRRRDASWHARSKRILWGVPGCGQF